MGVLSSRLLSLYTSDGGSDGRKRENRCHLYIYDGDNALEADADDTKETYASIHVAGTPE